MSDKKKTGPKSPFDDSLGNGVMKKPRYPIPVWDILAEKQTKAVLNRMAIDESYRLRIWASVDED